MECAGGKSWEFPGTVETANAGRGSPGGIPGREICGIYERCRAAEGNGHGFHAENAGSYKGVWGWDTAGDISGRNGDWV